MHNIARIHTTSRTRVYAKIHMTYYAYYSTSSYSSRGSSIVIYFVSTQTSLHTSSNRIVHR